MDTVLSSGLSLSLPKLGPTGRRGREVGTLKRKEELEVEACLLGSVLPEPEEEESIDCMDGAIQL